jgi:dihydrofolate reductase
MRKLYIFNLITLDGYFAGPGGDLSWHNVGEDIAEFNEFAMEQLGTVDTFVFGRVTYDMMASFWPTAQGQQEDPVVAARMNTTPKLVFSRTLKQAAWENSHVIGGDAVVEMKKLKAGPGKDMMIFGSSTLATAWLPHGLIDEVRLMVVPIVLGGGMPLFGGVPGRQDLSLLRTRTFKGTGNVLLTYVPKAK